ncbi:MAG: 50S ribosomal protein L3 [Nanoarchaeota archaeon]|nr:50S ribosomal protein L3 [Nanoarchaeota archaeon]
MTDENGSRSGSLQFYPRVRAKKVIPSVNWRPVKKTSVGLLGFVGYKVGMISVFVKDDTEASLTKGKRITVPATIVECPSMKIYSVRFYKGSKVLKDVVVTKDKDLKKKIKLSSEIKNFEEAIKDLKDLNFEDVRVLLYTNVKITTVGKKKPDMIEVGLSGSNEEKLIFIKERIGKDILVSEVFSDGLIDVRGVTKGFGTQGPVKRFGISLKSHKSEKGRRRPGSLAPWHPARVTFRAPQAGQTGYHNRITYNNVILKIGNINENDINKKGGFEHYGVIRGEYIVLRGSIPGPSKRGIVMTLAIRPSKYLAKKKLEVLEIR